MFLQYDKEEIEALQRRVCEREMRLDIEVHRVCDAQAGNIRDKHDENGSC